jgi:hypothetical protein
VTSSQRRIGAPRMRGGGGSRGAGRRDRFPARASARTWISRRVAARISAPVNNVLPPVIDSVIERPPKTSAVRPSTRPAFELYISLEGQGEGPTSVSQTQEGDGGGWKRARLSNRRDGYIRLGQRGGERVDLAPFSLLTRSPVVGRAKLAARLLANGHRSVPMT